MDGTLVGLAMTALVAGFLFARRFARPLSAPPDRRFSPGQEWRYRTRPGEEGSTLVIGWLEDRPGSGVFVHVAIRGVRVGDPRSGTGHVEGVPHAVFLRGALAASVTEPTGRREPLPEGFEALVADWRLRAFQGVALPTWLPVAEAIPLLERQNHAAWVRARPEVRSALGWLRAVAWLAILAPVGLAIQTLFLEGGFAGAVPASAHSTRVVIGILIMAATGVMLVSGVGLLEFERGAGKRCQPWIALALGTELLGFPLGFLGSWRLLIAPTRVAALLPMLWPPACWPSRRYFRCSRRA